VVDVIMSGVVVMGTVVVIVIAMLCEDVCAPWVDVRAIATRVMVRVHAGARQCIGRQK
jgi:hypothetical protein